MKLSEMKENQQAIITDLNTKRIQRRLFDLGFMTGQKITCTNIGLFGSPIAYSLCGCTIALRKKDADEIGVSI